MNIELRKKVAERLTELRKARFPGLKPEQVKTEAKALGYKIGARTIREAEKPASCNPRLETLDVLARLYNSSLGDLFRFSATDSDGVMVGNLNELAKDKELKKALSTIFARVQVRPSLAQQQQPERQRDGPRPEIREEEGKGAGSGLKKKQPMLPPKTA